jgi:hypothetical protein
MIVGAEAGEDGITVFSDEDAWDVIEAIPNDSAAGQLLIEHHWAVPLRNAVVRAGGFRISDGFVSPLDLVDSGLLSHAEAKLKDPNAEYSRLDRCGCSKSVQTTRSSSA